MPFVYVGGSMSVIRGSALGPPERLADKWLHLGWKFSGVQVAKSEGFSRAVALSDRPSKAISETSGTKEVFVSGGLVPRGPRSLTAGHCFPDADTGRAVHTPHRCVQMFSTD